MDLDEHAGQSRTGDACIVLSMDKGQPVAVSWTRGGLGDIPEGESPSGANLV